ncbi:MAG: N-acetylmuramoyl-L-alanine amidase [Myxococcaceae bacterium]|nr:N-acetylmuramoyl-L-alanine amidase [Myxococcaceae bacterium]
MAIVLCLTAASALAGPVVVLDPGHGGAQAGANSPKGLQEKALALDLAMRVRAILQGRGLTVHLTRSKDVELDLKERVKSANALKPDLFLSIHANSMPTRRLRQNTSGIETYFLSASASGEQAKKVAARENAEAGDAHAGPQSDTLAFILADLQRAEAHKDSSRLAYAVQEALIAKTGAVDRGVQQAPFYVLMGLEAPAALVEVGFISHPDEGAKLGEPEHQAAVAQAIADGVRVFLEQLEAREGKPSP